MDTNRMKLGLVYIFSENKQISKKAKLQLINFIENADINQLKVLAMDGELVPKGTFDKQTEEVVNDRFATMPHIEESLKKASVAGMIKISK